MSELSRYAITGTTGGQPVQTIAHPGAGFPIPLDDVPELMAAKLVVALLLLAVAYLVFRYGPRCDRMGRLARIIVPAMLAIIAVHELHQLAELLGAWLYLAKGVTLL